MTTIDNARALLADASRIEVFTGAGMSADRSEKVAELRRPRLTWSST